MKGRAPTARQSRAPRPRVMEAEANGVDFRRYVIKFAEALCCLSQDMKLVTEITGFLDWGERGEQEQGVDHNSKRGVTDKTSLEAVVM